MTLQQLVDQARDEGEMLNIRTTEEQYECFYCCSPLSRRQMTEDHVIPRATDGNNSAWNKVISCSRCNQLKGAMTLENFRAKIMRMPYNYNRKAKICYRIGQMIVFRNLFLRKMVK